MKDVIPEKVIDTLAKLKPFTIEDMRSLKGEARVLAQERWIAYVKKERLQEKKEIHNIVNKIWNHTHKEKINEYRKKNRDKLNIYYRE